MSAPYLGEIRMFAGNFNPRGWALCSGQLLSIQQNTALFAILGTTFGGNGQTNFALPDLQGRAPIGFGNGLGLSPYALGQEGGSEGVTLNSSQIPAHTHTGSTPSNSAAGNTSTPAANTVLAASTTRDRLYSTAAADTNLPWNTSPVGGNQPHENRQPYLAVTFIIALQGIFPSRN
jgi:microcystin-dependent protein